MPSLPPPPASAGGARNSPLRGSPGRSGSGPSARALPKTDHALARCTTMAWQMLDGGGLARAASRQPISDVRKDLPRSVAEFDGTDEVPRYRPRPVANRDRSGEVINDLCGSVAPMARRTCARRPPSPEPSPRWLERTASWCRNPEPSPCSLAPAASWCRNPEPSPCSLAPAASWCRAPKQRWGTADRIRSSGRGAPLRP